MSDIETIIHDFGKVQEEVSKRILTHYPTLVFPESLLPYKKDEIVSAFEKAIEMKKGDEDAVALLNACLTFLNGFIDDREAYNLNHKLLAQDSYWDAIHKK